MAMVALMVTVMATAVLILDLSLVTEQWASPKHKLVARR